MRAIADGVDPLDTRATEMSKDQLREQAAVMAAAFGGWKIEGLLPCAPAFGITQREGHGLFRQAARRSEPDFRLGNFIVRHAPALRTLLIPPRENQLAPFDIEFVTARLQLSNDLIIREHLPAPAFEQSEFDLILCA